MFLCAADFEEIVVDNLLSGKETVIKNPLDIDCIAAGNTVIFQISYLDSEGYLNCITSQDGNTRFFPKDDVL